MVKAIAGPALAWVVSDRLKSIQEVAQPGFPPLLVFHGTQDKLIPYEHAEELVAATSARRRVMVPLRGYGHNDIFQESNFDVMCEQFAQTYASLRGLRPLELRIPLPLFEVPAAATQAEQEPESSQSIVSSIVSSLGALSAQSVEASAGVATSGRF